MFVFICVCIYAWMVCARIIKELLIMIIVIEFKIFNLTCHPAPPPHPHPPTPLHPHLGYKVRSQERAWVLFQCCKMRAYAHMYTVASCTYMFTSTHMHAHWCAWTYSDVRTHWSTFTLHILWCACAYIGTHTHTDVHAYTATHTRIHWCTCTAWRACTHTHVEKF